jgi:hypothetical protein
MFKILDIFYEKKNILKEIRQPVLVLCLTMQGARVENVFLNGELGALEGATCEFMSKEPEKEEDPRRKSRRTRGRSEGKT